MYEVDCPRCTRAYEVEEDAREGTCPECDLVVDLLTEEEAHALGVPVPEPVAAPEEAAPEPQEDPYVQSPCPTCAGPLLLLPEDTEGLCAHCEIPLRFIDGVAHLPEPAVTPPPVAPAAEAAPEPTPVPPQRFDPRLPVTRDNAPLVEVQQTASSEGMDEADVDSSGVDPKRAAPIAPPTPSPRPTEAEIALEPADAEEQDVPEEAVQAAVAPTTDVTFAPAVPITPENAPLVSCRPVQAPSNAMDAVSAGRTTTGMQLMMSMPTVEDVPQIEEVALSHATEMAGPIELEETLVAEQIEMETILSAAPEIEVHGVPELVEVLEPATATAEVEIVFDEETPVVEVMDAVQTPVAGDETPDEGEDGPLLAAKDEDPVEEISFEDDVTLDLAPDEPPAAGPDASSAAPPREPAEPAVEVTSDNAPIVEVAAAPPKEAAAPKGDPPEKPARSGPPAKPPSKGAKSKPVVERVIDDTMPDGIPAAREGKAIPAGKAEDAPIETCAACTHPFRHHPKDQEVQCPHCGVYLEVIPTDELEEDAEAAVAPEAGEKKPRRIPFRFGKKKSVGPEGEREVDVESEEVGATSVETTVRASEPERTTTPLADEVSIAPEPELDLEPEVEEEPLVAEAEPELDLEEELEPEPVFAVEPEPELDLEPEVEEEPLVAVAEPELDLEEELEPETVVAEPEPELDLEEELEPEPVFAVEPEPELDVEPEEEPLVAEPEPELDLEEELEPEPVVAESEPELDLEEELEPEPVVAIESEPELDLEPEEEPLVAEAEPELDLEEELEPEPVVAEPEPELDLEEELEPEPVVAEPEPELDLEEELEPEPVVAEPEPELDLEEELEPEPEVHATAPEQTPAVTAVEPEPLAGPILEPLGDEDDPEELPSFEVAESADGEEPPAATRRDRR